MSTFNKSSRVDRARLLQAGVQQHLANEPSLTLDGKDYKPSDVISICLGFIQAVDAVTAAKATWKATVKSMRTAAATFRAIEVAMHRFLVSKYGADNSVLADFGFEPKTRKQLPVAEKAVAAEKSVATRQARGTKGTKQKKAIKGNPPATPTASGSSQQSGSGNAPKA